MYLNVSLYLYLHPHFFVYVYTYMFAKQEHKKEEEKKTSTHDTDKKIQKRKFVKAETNKTKKTVTTNAQHSRRLTSFPSFLLSFSYGTSLGPSCLQFSLNTIACLCFVSPVIPFMCVCAAVSVSLSASLSSCVFVCLCLCVHACLCTCVCTRR